MTKRVNFFDGFTSETTPDTVIVSASGVIGAWQGAWVSQDYVKDDAVYFEGSAYICTVSTTASQDPTDVGFWDVATIKGESIDLDETEVTFDEAKIATIEALPSITPLDRYMVSIADDTRANQALPAALSGNMKLHLVVWDGTNWFDFGQWIGSTGPTGGTTGQVAMKVSGDDFDVEWSNNFKGNKTFDNDVTVTGNLTVNGTTTSVNSDVLDVADANITVNTGGTEASADLDDAGITVDMSDATNCQIGFDSTLTSKFKIGEIGSESEVLSSTAAQVASNKSIQDPSRSDVKKDTDANLVTYALTASNGQWCFATDTKKMYQVVDTLLVEAGGAGGGSGVLNIISRATTYTLLDGDDVVMVDTSTPWTLTLFAASGNSGKTVKIIKTSSDFGLLTIDGNGSETINGALTTLVSTQYEQLTLICDGVGWFILERKSGSAWQSYTPVFSGFGTVAAQSFHWKRIGDTLHIKGTFTSGTSSATQGKVTFPSGLVYDTAKHDFTSNETAAGVWFRGAGAIAHGGTVLMSDSVTDGFGFSNQGIFGGTSISSLVRSGGNNSLASGEEGSIIMSVPIEDWKDANE